MVLYIGLIINKINKVLSFHYEIFYSNYWVSPIPAVVISVSVFTALHGMHTRS